MTLNEIGAECARISASKGFSSGLDHHSWDENDLNIPVKLALIHSEVSEALEEFRKEHRLPAFAGELADILIRTLHLASMMGLDMDEAVASKMEKNRHRPFRHGGRII